MTIDRIDYQVRFIKLGHNVKEAVTKNSDDSYTIFIDNRLCKEAQNEAFLHAIKHILDNDFEKVDVNQIELGVRLWVLLN